MLYQRCYVRVMHPCALTGQGFLVDLRADAGSTALAIRGKLPSFR